MTDVHHLGTLVGDPEGDRIVAVSTAAVFDDRSLLKTFWGVDEASLDSGFQGHLYTRPNDILVLRAPTWEIVDIAIGMNYEIWGSLTGIDIVSPNSRLLIASDYTLPPSRLPSNISWHVGALIDAATQRHRETGETFLAFGLNSRILKMLSPQHQADRSLREHAHATSLLMDKNMCMQILEENGVDCARTFPFGEGSLPIDALGRLPTSWRYVFKPAGGASGIGSFPNTSSGASLDQILGFVDTLFRSDRLPRRFQIQEFVPGTPFGISAFFIPNKSFEIFEIHEQFVNEHGQSVGSRWTPTAEAEQMTWGLSLCEQLLSIDDPPLSGLICMDVINGKIIEVNPRLTAAAPIAHLLRQRGHIAAHIGGGFNITQIDLNTQVVVPPQIIGDGTLRNWIDIAWKERGVLILPQGLNPFGKSRLIFINDDPNGMAQHEILRHLHHE